MPLTDMTDYSMLLHLRTAAEDLLNDVRRRYPGEELKCPYMRALDDMVRMTNAHIRGERVSIGHCR